MIDATEVMEDVSDGDELRLSERNDETDSEDDNDREGAGETESLSDGVSDRCGVAECDSDGLSVPLSNDTDCDRVAVNAAPEPVCDGVNRKVGVAVLDGLIAAVCLVGAIVLEKVMLDDRLFVGEELPDSVIDAPRGLKDEETDLVL